MVSSELALLSNLQTLDFSDNPTLKGGIPRGIWQEGLPASLRSLDLSYTGLTGSIPAHELPRWNQLTSLNLEGSSQITGGVPTEVGAMASLQDLTLSSTRVGRSLPTELGLLSQLTSLKLRNCKIQGRHPTELGQMSSLVHLDVGDNAMSGTIPSQIVRTPLLLEFDSIGSYLSVLSLPYHRAC